MQKKQFRGAVYLSAHVLPSPFHKQGNIGYKILIFCSVTWENQDEDEYEVLDEDVNKDEDKDHDENQDQDDNRIRMTIGSG